MKTVKSFAGHPIYQNIQKIDIRAGVIILDFDTKKYFLFPHYWWPIRGHLILKTNLLGPKSSLQIIQDQKEKFQG